MFGRKKLDEELAKTEPAKPPEKMYIVEVLTELDTIPSNPMNRERAERHARNIAQLGCMVTVNDEPRQWLLPHRIQDIRIREHT